MVTSHCNRRRQSGASLVELIIVLPVFAFLLAGIFEIALMYRTKALLNAATFEAAQQGSLNNALLGKMQDGLAQGMMPMYLRSRSATGVGTAYAQARLRIATSVGGVGIVSPTRNVFTQFREQQMIRTTRDNGERLQFVIPNDNLMWRNAQTRTINIGGQNVPMNVQDANVLKVRSYWCHKLLTPLLDRVLWNVASGPARLIVGPALNQDERRCAAISLATGDYYLAVTSSSVTRMQSPIVQDSLP
jgi:type II secretory pathway pseudopilin PulG